MVKFQNEITPNYQNYEFLKNYEDKAVDYCSEVIFRRLKNTTHVYLKWETCNAQVPGELDCHSAQLNLKIK